jgi:hypothetical protein
MAQFHYTFQLGALGGGGGIDVFYQIEGTYIDFENESFNKN